VTPDDTPSPTRAETQRANTLHLAAWTAAWLLNSAVATFGGLLPGRTTCA